MKKESFDENADLYSQWSVTKNKEYLDQFYAFAQITPTDSVIDVASGSGDFLINCADRVKKAKGIDFSGKIVDIANSHVNQNRIKNVSFVKGDITNIKEVPGEKYDVIICRMAFHHFEFPAIAFSNCLKYANKEVKVAMQDIVSHGVDAVDSYFNRFERLIDKTHKNILSESLFNEMFESNNICVRKSVILEREIFLEEYIVHAIQSDKDKKQLEILIEEGMRDPIISKYIFTVNKKVVFKRKVLLIYGNN